MEVTGYGFLANKVDNGTQIETLPEEEVIMQEHQTLIMADDGTQTLIEEGVQTDNPYEPSNEQINITVGSSILASSINS